MTYVRDTLLCRLDTPTERTPLRPDETAWLKLTFAHGAESAVYQVRVATVFNRCRLAGTLVAHPR